MKTTIPAFLYETDEETTATLERLMLKYGFMIRYAFKRLLEGQDKAMIEKYLSNDTGLTIRHSKDAVEDARQTIQSQHELVKLQVELRTKRLGKAEAKLQRLKESNVSLKKIKGLEAKVEKRKRKLALWQTHLQNHTFPPVVFGGKKKFWDRCKGNISKEEWQEARNGRLSARGDATKNGNPNIRVLYQDGAFSLQITLDAKQNNGRYEKLTLPLYVARKVSKKTGAINGRDYHGMLRDHLVTGKPYQVEILRRNGKFYVNVTVEELPATIATYPVNGIFGVDTNPDGLAVAHVLTDGNPASFQWLGDGGLQDYPATKREYSIGNLAKQLVHDAKTKGVSIAVENLKFSKDKEVSAKFHRMSHNFCYRKLLETIERN